jgi:hypothetical protein
VKQVMIYLQDFSTVGNLGLGNELESLNVSEK